MRLSPNSVFFGLFLLGLPVAVAAGWNLVSSHPMPPPAARPADVVAGAGRLGTAPVVPASRAARSGIVHWTPVGATAPPAAVVMPLPVAVTVTPARPSAGAGSTAPAVPSSPSPSFEPPVPTPTMITMTPPPPSPTPSEAPAVLEPVVTTAPVLLPTP